MQAAVVSRYGEAPHYGDFPDPQAQPGEVMVHVRAAGLHPLVKGMAAGSHYASGGELPMVPGVDGVGTLDNGERVYFVFARRPWGSMSERTVVSRDKCLPVPDGLEDVIAAAVANPGMSAWLSLKERAGVKPGETVLISGATGVAGRTAIQVARHLGAKRIIGTGRNLGSLEGAGLDAVIDLTQADDQVTGAFAAQAEGGIDVVIDYLWGHTTELLLDALGKTFKAGGSRPTRLVEVGSAAGNRISLPGATLRSVDLHLMGSGFGSVPLERILDAIPTLFALAAKRELVIDVEATPLRDVEAAWSRKTDGRRIVFTVG